MWNKSFFALFVFLVTNLVEAQAPGNVTATFPLWLKANAGTSTTTDGVGVQTWTDQALALGGSNNATQATAANRPFYKNLTPINFNPYLRFDGVNDVFAIASNTSINQVATYTRSNYTVFRTGASVISPVRQLIYKERNHQSGFNIYLYNGNLYCSAFKTNTAPTWPWKGNSIPVSANTTYLVSFVMNGTAANAGTINCYLNSSAFANLTGVGQILSVNAASNLGARQLRTNYEGVAMANANTDYSAIDLAEFAYYNSAHSNADRNKIESYLAVKYGITLNQTVAQNYTNSAGTVIFNATGTHNSYRNDIAGIMIDTNSALNQPQSKSVNTDAIVTMSTASAMANTESLLWGNDNDDNGVVQEIYTGVPSGISARLDRVWRVDQTGDVGTVTISFDLNGITQSGVTAADFRLLVDSANSDFTSGATQINAASYSGGIVTFNNVDFTGDDYFTLVTLVAPTPPTVTLSTNLSTIVENGGVASITATLSNIWNSDITVDLGFSGTATNPTDYVRSGTTITIPAYSLSGSVTVTAIDDLASEGSESVIVDIDSVTGGGTESGVQQVTVNITDDEPINNACDGQERLFTTELASGDVNTYNIAGTYQGTSTSSFIQNYEMIIDPDQNYRYLSSYGNLKISRANFDGTGEITLYDTSLYSANPPFQVTINQNQGKIYWTDWSNTANIFCANLDGTGTPVAIATGLNYPTGMQIDKNTGRLFVYFGFNAPVNLTVTTTDGSCSPITLTTIANTGLDLAYNLTIDPPGNRLFFVDYNSQTIKKINTDGTSLLTLRTLTAPGDQMRDIVYNKNTDNLFWVHTNGVIQRALADGSGGITTIVAAGLADSRSIDICVDDAPPRLTSFYSTSADLRYCPIVPNTITIRAVYDEAVVSGSVLTAVLNNGASVLLNNISGNEIFGTYTVGATGSGQTIADLSVASITGESVSDVNNNLRSNSVPPASPNNLGDSSDIIVDTSAPVIIEVTPVTTPTTNRNPTYVISSDEIATITFGGSCDSATTNLVVGSNNITLDSDGLGGQLADGVYSDCTITVTDLDDCNTTVYNITPFEVAGTIPSVTLTRNPATIAEAAGVATFTATLSNTYALPVTVDLGFTGTATNVSDYTLSGTQIVIPALSTTGSITVTAVSDTLDELDETVIVDITSVTNGTESGVQQATTTILDDDNPPTVTLSRSPASITEEGGIATITATLNTLSGLNVTVNLSYSGTATNGSDYSVASSILIPAGNISANISLTALEDVLNEVPAETVIVDISSVTNGTENGVQQVTISIVEDAVCNQQPWPAPNGFTNYMAISFEKTFNPGGVYSLPSGEDFDDYLLRDQNAKDAKRDRAYAFFFSEYGLDFATDGVEDSPGIFTIYMPDNITPRVMLRYISFDSDFDANAGTDFEAKINAASGYQVDESGGDLRAGIYQVLTFDAETDGLNNGTLLGGTWGGAGLLVPFGTILEYGEYELEVAYLCTDNPNPDYIASDKFLVEFKSSKPSLADYNGERQGQFLDIPQIFEYDIIPTSPNFAGGEITGRTEIRQDFGTNDVTAISSIVLTESP